MKGKLRAPRRPALDVRRLRGQTETGAPRWKGGVQYAARLAGGAAHVLRRTGGVRGMARLAQTAVLESRLSIRVKLLGGAGVVLALLLVVGIIGWVNTRSFASDFSKLYDHRLVPLVQIGEAEQALMDMRAGVQVYENAGPIIREKVKKSRAEQRKTIDEQMGAYAKTDLAPQAKELLAAWDKAYSTYAQGVDQHMQLIDNDAASQATLLNNQTLEPRYLEALSTLKRLKEVQRQAGAEMNQSVSARADRTNMIVAGTVAVALVLGLGVAGTLAWVIAGAASQVTVAARGLAQGDLDQQIDIRSRDEMGELATAFREMMEYLREMADVAGAVARGDLSRTIQPKSERDVLGTAFHGMIADLRALVAQVQDAAAAVAVASGELGPAAAQASDVVEQVTDAVRGIAEGAQQNSQSAQTSYEAMDQLARAIEGIARGAGDQAQQVQAASGIASEMAAGVQRVSTSAGEVAKVSANTRAAAQDGARAVRETVDGMHEIRAVVTQVASRVEELGKLGQKIGAVVETIDDIAEQTNLLALNAAIEAARAGEHGRGFAVVADEVRKLAERSQNETKAIAQLIADVRNGTRDAVKAMETGSAKVQAGVRLADQAGEALAQILNAVDATVDQINGIAEAARELEAGAVAVVEAMESISAVVEENTATSEEMAAESTHVTEAIQSISAVAEENSAVTREVSASAEQMSAQVQRIGDQARELATTAEHLRSLVARFTLEATDEEQRLRLVA